MKTDRDAKIWVGGEELPFGYGIEIARAEDDTIFDLNLLGPVSVALSPRLVAWLTQLNSAGKYERDRLLDPLSEIVIDSEHYHVEFCNGTGTAVIKKPAGVHLVEEIERWLAEQ